MKQKAFTTSDDYLISRFVHMKLIAMSINNVGKSYNPVQIFTK